MIDRAAHHHRDERVARHVPDEALAHSGTVAEDRVAVGHIEDLLELVADEKHRAALGFQPAHDDEQLLHLAMAECCRRLIHDHDPRLDRERAGDLHQMLLRHAELAHRQGRIDPLIEPGEDRAGALSHRCPIDHAALARPVGHEDILGHRKIVEDDSFLEDGADAEPPGAVRRADLHRLAIQADDALIGVVNAREDLHHR